MIIISMSEVIVKLGSLTAIEVAVLDGIRPDLKALAKTVNNKTRVKCKIEFSSTGKTTYACRVYTGRFFKKKILVELLLGIEGNLQQNCEISSVNLMFRDSSMEKLEKGIKKILETHIFLTSAKIPYIVSTEV